MATKAAFTSPLAQPGSTRAGRFVTQGEGPSRFQAFLPSPLPPDPPVRFGAVMQELLERASLAVGRLDGIARLLPDHDAFLYMYVRKEAVLSSQIEGTQSSLTDLLLHENEAAPGVPLADVEEVSSYVRAMSHGLDLLRTRLPLSLRLIREVHRVLVSGTRGGDKTPGEFRRSQNWIGGSRPGNARFVPPPPHEVMPALDNLEKFLHDQPTRTPALLKAGLAHAQFETVHPFLDGNGRVGRLLITMILIAEGVLAEPMLYMSLHFKRNQREYYDRLQQVRTDGDWEGWLDFYLDGIASVATQATDTIKKVLRLFEEDRSKVLGARDGSIYQRAAAQSNALVHEHICRRALVTIAGAAQALSISKPTVTRALQDMEALGIVREVTGKSRNRLYLYSKYLELLDEGT